MLEQIYVLVRQTCCKNRKCVITKCNISLKMCEIQNQYVMLYVDLTKRRDERGCRHRCLH